MELPITSDPAPEHRGFYTYFGRRLFGLNRPLQVPDSKRSRPSIVLGASGYGKSEWLMNLAVQDILKGRMVIYIDGKADADCRNKLFYYTHKIARRPFLALLPHEKLDSMSHTWNPFVTATVPIGAMAEAFFNAYQPPQSKEKEADSYYRNVSRDVFTMLVQALHNSGWGYSLRDICAILDRSDMIDWLRGYMTPNSIPHYCDLLNAREKSGRNFQKELKDFILYLRKFDNWTINSYNPDIVLEKQMYVRGGVFIYVGLPVNMEPSLMSAIGNILLNQIMMLSGYVQSSGNARRKAMSVIIDEAQAFIDVQMADLICRVRTSGMMLTLSTQSVADLQRISNAFARQIIINAPNCVMFNPRDLETAEWFSGMSGSEVVAGVSHTFEDGEDDAGASVKGTIKAVKRRHVSNDAVVHLQTGQMFYSPPDSSGEPFFLASPMLHYDANNPNNWHRRIYYHKQPELKPLGLAQKISQTEKDYAG